MKLIDFDAEAETFKKQMTWTDTPPEVQSLVIGNVFGFAGHLIQIQKSGDDCGLSGDFEIRVGKYGAYFYDKVRQQPLSLFEALQVMNAART